MAFKLWNLNFEIQGMARQSLVPCWSWTVFLAKESKRVAILFLILLVGFRCARRWSTSKIPSLFANGPIKLFLQELILASYFLKVPHKGIKSLFQTYTSTHFKSRAIEFFMG